MKPRFLILETSSRNGLVALGAGDALIAERRLPEARRHARDLAPAAKELLAESGWQPSDIDAVVVGVGPGSYTGLRVGIMSAKAFAYATNCKLIALETFSVIARQVSVACTSLQVVADAQQDRIYHQPFERSPQEDWIPSAALSIVPLNEWLPKLTEAICVSGPGLAKIESHLPSGVVVAPEHLRTPTADTMLQIANDRFQSQRFDDMWIIEPLYLRPSAAEQQWDHRPSGNA